MKCFPAIDLLNGQCVRLNQGDYDKATVYDINPLSRALQFQSDGARQLHIVDLNGARTGKPVQMALVKVLSKKLCIPIQVGGGIRCYEDAAAYLSSGVWRIVIGTKAITDERLIQKLIRTFGSDRIVVSLDTRQGKVVTDGWLKNSGVQIEVAVKKMRRLSVTTILVTDTLRDGMLTSPNFNLLKKIQSLGVTVIASGGVASVSNLKKLSSLKIPEAIIGTALYKGTIKTYELELCEERQETLSTRVIPCLDISNGRVVKGTQFISLRDAGDPVKIATQYAKDGADELVFLDIAATSEKLKTLTALVEKIARNVDIPFTVGGGIRSVEEVDELLKAGADKVTINSAAVLNPALITECANRYGKQCIVVAIDTKKIDGKYYVYINGGKKKTSLDVLDWAQECERRGAGELLITSIDRDGTNKGFDCALLKKISTSITIPVIASGGAGSPDDIAKAIINGKADAVLAASIFHYKKTTIQKVKKYLASQNIRVRI